MSRRRGHVYRIASKFPDGSGTEWTGQPWAWDVIDLDAPIVRIDGHPTITDHGYADDQATAMRRCCGVLFKHDLADQLLESDPLAKTWAALVRIFRGPVTGG